MQFLTLASIISIATVTLLPLLLLLLLTTVSSADAAFCNQKANTTGPANQIPIWEGKPTFVRRVNNGELYMVGEGEDKINLVHLYGETAEDWGRAHGSLMREELEEVVNGFYGYLYSEIDNIVNNTLHPLHIYLPDAAINKIASIGIDAVLDIQNEWALPFMPKSYYDEIRGLIAGANATRPLPPNITYDTVVRLFSIPELTRGRCSFIGAYPPATAGSVLQLRSLDWDMGTHLQKHPQLTVYHTPQSGALGNTFLNIGWSGVTFTLSGISSKGHGISEIGISYPKMERYPGFPPTPPFGEESWGPGLPFVWLERSLIQFADNLTAGVELIKHTNRTCHLVLGMADANEKKAVVVQYSHRNPRFWYADRKEDAAPFAPWHPFVGEGVVYEAMDWSCPHYQTIMSDRLRKFYGKLTAPMIATEVIPVVQTGDLHANIYDLTEGTLLTANAKADGESGPAPAYMRQFVKVDTKAAFAKKQGQDY